MVRSLKSSYWPRPVEGQERTGFRPPPLGVVGRCEARVGQSLQSNSPEEQLHPAPDQPNSGQLGSPPLSAVEGPILSFL